MRAPAAIGKGSTFMKSRLHRSGIPVAAVTLATALGFAGYNLGSSPAANAASTASTTAKLQISPSKIFTCSESSPVTVTVSGFAANSSVNLEIGAAAANPAAVISTNASGDGSIVLQFGSGQNEHDYFAGDYKFFATQSTLDVTKTLTDSNCG
jgi:hypothetical protein